MEDVKSVPFRFQVSDLTLLAVKRNLIAKQFALGEPRADTPDPRFRMRGEGMMLRSIPSEEMKPGISMSSVNGERVLRYVMHCFPRYYVDLGTTFDAYKAKFSGKSLSTIRRKIKKFADLGGGQIRWERFTHPEELERFWTLSRQLSSKTYQERLLHAGLPDDSDYFEEAKRLAARDELRAFLLFDADTPVSYLFCPVRDGVVEYAYLGYDPAYARHSVGTVLQWLALESLFEEARFRYFDFTEGESEHKRLFATHRENCANVVLLRASVSNSLLAWGHWSFTRAIETVGRWLDRGNYRSRIRRWLRFRHLSAQ